METQKQKVDFTSGKIFSKIIFFIFPIICTNLLQTFYNAADMIIVSLSSEVNAVGAVGTTSSFINLVVNVFIGFAVGTNVMVARWIGAKEENKAQKVVHTSVIMSVLFGIAGMLIGFVLTRPVLVAMGTTGSLLKLAITYTLIYFAGTPFISVTNYLISVFRAKGDAKTPLVILAIAGALNVLLNLFFVVVVGLSVEGVSLATMISNIFSSTVLFIKLCKDDNTYTKIDFKKLKLDKHAFKDIMKVGLPAGIQGALFSFSNMLIQSSIVTVNNNVVPPNTGSDFQPIVSGSAAQGNLEGFTYMAMNAVYQGVITFTSQNIGAGKPERIRKIMGSCIAIVSMVGLAMSTVMYLLRVPLLSLYGIKPGEEGSLDRLAFEAALIRNYFIGLPYFFCGIMEVGSGVLRGMGKSMASTVISLVGSCVLRVIWLATVFPAHQTLECIFVCYPLSWAITFATQMIVVHILLKRILKAHNKI